MVYETGHLSRYDVMLPERLDVNVRIINLIFSCCSTRIVTIACTGAITRNFFYHGCRKRLKIRNVKERKKHNGNISLERHAVIGKMLPQLMSPFMFQSINQSIN